MCDPNSGKYGRGRETTDIDRENTDIQKWTGKIRTLYISSDWIEKVFIIEENMKKRKLE